MAGGGGGRLTANAPPKGSGRTTKGERTGQRTCSVRLLSRKFQNLPLLEVWRGTMRFGASFELCKPAPAHRSLWLATVFFSSDWQPCCRPMCKVWSTHLIYLRYRYPFLIRLVSVTFHSKWLASTSLSICKNRSMITLFQKIRNSLYFN